MVRRLTLGGGVLAGSLMAALAATAVLAQPAPGARPAPPAGAAPGGAPRPAAASAAPTKDYKVASAGTYTLDTRHVGLVARVPHMGFSYSVFRFDKVTGSLEWNPANPSASKLTASVDPKSVTSNVAGFGEEIAGDRFLKSGANPTATFTSTAFKQTDATHGKVDGNLTLMGVTKPVTFDVTLIGAGKNMRGQDDLGVTAKTMIDPKDYGLPTNFIVGPIELTVDVEFLKAPAAPAGGAPAAPRP